MIFHFVNNMWNRFKFVDVFLKCVKKNENYLLYIAKTFTLYNLKRMLKSARTINTYASDNIHLISIFVLEH